MKENSSYKVPYIDKKGILSKKLFTQNFVSSQVFSTMLHIFKRVVDRICSAFIRNGIASNGRNKKAHTC